MTMKQEEVQIEFEISGLTFNEMQFLGAYFYSYHIEVPFSYAIIDGNFVMDLYCMKFTTKEMADISQHVLKIYRLADPIPNYLTFSK